MGNFNILKGQVIPGIKAPINHLSQKSCGMKCNNLGKLPGVYGVQSALPSVDYYNVGVALR